MEKRIIFMLAFGFIISFAHAQDKPTEPAKAKKDSTSKVIKTKVESNGKQMDINDPAIQKLLKEKGIDLNNLDKYGAKEGKTSTTVETDKGTRTVNVYNVKGNEIPQEVRDMMKASAVQSKGDLDKIKGLKSYEYSYEDKDGIRMNFLKIIKDSDNEIYVWEDDKMTAEATSAIELYGIDPSIFKDMANPFITGNKASLGIALRNGPGGVHILEVLENSGSKNAGLQADDLIISANGGATLDKATLAKILASFDPYEKVMIGYVRNDVSKMASVILLPSATFAGERMKQEGVQQGDELKIKTEGEKSSKEITIKKKTGEGGN
jgi:hypothetical protein